MNLEALHLFIKYLYEKPSCIFCVIALWGAVILYQDNREFISDQQVILKEISKTQYDIQKSLVELNLRVQNLENKNKNQNHE